MGAFSAVVEDGRVIGVIPFARAPDPSPLIAAIPDAVYAATRIPCPMVRQGWLAGDKASGAGRGREAFVPGLVGARARPRRRRVGAGAARLWLRRDHGRIAGLILGRPVSRGARVVAALPRRLRRLCRSGEQLHFGAALTFLPHVLGTAQAVTGPLTSCSSIAKHTRPLILFGDANPKNTQVAKGGCAWHGTSGWFAALAQAGVRVVTVSPIREDSPDVVAPEWIAIRSNTDTALMLALAHTLIAEGRHDAAFLARYCGAAPILLQGVLQRTLGKPLDELAREALLEPLGITDVEWTRFPNVTSEGIEDFGCVPVIWRSSASRCSIAECGRASRSSRLTGSQKRPVCRSMEKAS